jgi:hypothetical protein
MEVHAHSHTARKKWYHYFWEFFMLFLAVTLGFFVENQREHFTERKKEKDYIRSLWLDLRADTSQLKYIISRLSESNNKIDTLITLLKSNTRDQNTRKIYSLAWRIPFADILPQPSNKTFEQLKSSGNLRLIHDNKIVDDIGTYYMTYNFMTLGGPGQMQFQNRHDLYLATYKLFDAAVFQKMIHLDDTDTLTANDAPRLLSNDPIIINEICSRYYYMYLTRAVLNDWEGNLLSGADSLINEIQKKYHLK